MVNQSSPPNPGHDTSCNDRPRPSPHRTLGVGYALNIHHPFRKSGRSYPPRPLQNCGLLSVAFPCLWALTSGSFGPALPPQVPCHCICVIALPSRSASYQTSEGSPCDTFGVFFVACRSMPAHGRAHGGIEIHSLRISMGRQQAPGPPAHTWRKAVSGHTWASSCVPRAVAALAEPNDSNHGPR